MRESVEVKLFADRGELFVLAKSEGRRAKETAMRRRRLARLLWKLRALRRGCPARDQLLLRLGAARKEAGRAYGFVQIRLPKEGEEVTAERFTFRLAEPEQQLLLHRLQLSLPPQPPPKLRARSSEFPTEALRL